MKKIIVMLLIIISALSLCSCNRDENVDYARYTIEMGRKVFVSSQPDVEYTDVSQKTLPVGYHFQQAMSYDKYVVYKYIDEEDKTDENKRFGLIDSDGNQILDCVYSLLSYSGNFIRCVYYSEDGVYTNQVFYSDGVKLMSSDDAVEIRAVNDEYCVLYYDGKSQIFDKDGTTYLRENNQMPDTMYYSICDGYLFGYDVRIGDWFIWQLFKNIDGEVPYGFAVLKQIYSAENSLYTLGYLGDNRFLVVETINDSTNYDYYEKLNGTTYYIRQDARIYDVQSGESEHVDLEYPIVSFTNKYTPTLTVEQRQNYNLNDGYSQVFAGIVSDSKERTGYRYFVLNNQCEFVIKYPESVTASAMKFIDGYGFCGGSGNSGSAGLYYMNCDAVWILDDAEYYAQSFSSGKYVLSRATVDGIRYGVLDSDGNITASFEYAYISPYRNGLAFYRTVDGISGIMDADCNSVYAINDLYSVTASTYYGVYGFSSGDKRGLKSFDGNVLIDAKYDSIEYLEKTGNTLIAICSDGDTEHVYRLS